MNTATEQQAQLADVEVAVDRRPRSRLKMVHPHITLGQLEAAFDRPPGEGHAQHPPQ